MVEIGNHVRTHDGWNNHREPIEGIVTGFETLKYHKSIPHQDPRTGLISYTQSMDRYEYTTVAVLDNGEKIHESNLVVVGD